MNSTKTVVVTGAGAGIGLAILQRLDRDGFVVIGIERSAEAAASAEKSLTNGGTVIVGDVANRAVLGEARRRAEGAGELTAWVNNAGVAISGTLHDPIEDEVAQVFAVNLLGVYWGCAEAVQSFIANSVKGSVVNISSIHGRAAFPGWAAYDTAKGGVDALTRYLAVEYGPLGIRANAIAPGAIRTEMVERVIADAPQPEKAEREMSEIHPLNRLGEPSEIASTVAFLVSNESSFMSGQSIAVDGAATARCFRFDASPDIQAILDAKGTS